MEKIPPPIIEPSTSAISAGSDRVVDLSGSGCMRVAVGVRVTLVQVMSRAIILRDITPPHAAAVREAATTT
jgi:hypothetical protein